MKQTINKFKDGIIMGLGIIFIIFLSGITYASYLWITQSDVASGDTLSKNSWNEMINNQNYLKQEVESIPIIPSGAIMMFESTCPSGWSEKTSYRNKMIRGETTGNASDLGTGGSDDAVIVSHAHSINPPSTTTTSNGNHRHTDDAHDATGNGNNSDSAHSASGLEKKIYSDYAGSHTHTVDIAAFDSATTGVSGVGKNIPAYQEVIFCVKN